jgi:hypothetical protein
VKNLVSKLCFQLTLTLSEKPGFKSCFSQMGKLVSLHFGIENPMQHIMRLQFACMNPKSKILKHTDRGGWVQHGHRIHIPLIVPSSAARNGDLQFVMMHGERGDIPVPLKAGLAPLFTTSLLRVKTRFS